ncbi:MAG: hypothetical protein U5K27_09435 [Desulfotignum sp.]|nr:hypothetical protein [Desulfotignum sp.]
MNMTISETLEYELKKYLGKAVPAHAATDIHAALALADILKSRGFAFHLKDLCPGSPNETRWQAVFSKEEYEFTADHPDSPAAVCTAAIGALSTLETTFSLS